MRWAPVIGLTLVTACSAAPEAGAPSVSQARQALEAAPARAGARATVMVVFATWADGARELLPRLAELERSYGERGLQVVGVAIDEDQRFVEPFLRELGVTLRVLGDPGGREIEQKAKVLRLPALLLLDAKGELHARAGTTGADPIAELEKKLEALLSPPRPPSEGAASGP